MKKYDLTIIGAGSGGLTAAGFAARLGAHVALVEKDRIGGDCTWTGCVPSKALLKAAKIAHSVRTAGLYGIRANEPAIDMAAIRDYVQTAVRQVYRFETPEELERQKIELLMGPARFVDSKTIVIDDRTISSKDFLITTGAKPNIPAIVGLSDVPFFTYERIFDNDRLPKTMIVVGGGPIGVEIAQAYQRLGSLVTVVAERLLPKDEPEAAEVIRRVLEREGVRCLWSRAKSARQDGTEIVIATEKGEARGDLLFIATGRRPLVDGLDLEKAGVAYTKQGIPVNEQLRTNVANIYAAGDVLGGYQFTHVAGWQAFQAVRNALLPGSSSGVADVVPWTTFTAPEVAHVGATEAEAREKFGEEVQVGRWEMQRSDRAICENETDGFIKIVAKEQGPILGATIVAERAGEAITEIVVAMKHKLKLANLSSAIHVYPTYSTPVQQITAEMAIDKLLSGASGKIVRRLSKLITKKDRFRIIP